MEEQKASILDERAIATLGIRLNQDVITHFNDKSTEEISDMNDAEFITYLCETGKLEYFMVDSNSTCRKKIAQVPYHYRDAFASYFLKDLDNKDIVLEGRNNERENAFLNQLAKIGVYVTSIDNRIPFIYDMTGFESLISNDKNVKYIELYMGEKIGVRGTLSNDKQRRQLIRAVREGINNEKKQFNSVSEDRDEMDDSNSDMDSVEFLRLNESDFEIPSINDLGNTPQETMTPKEEEKQQKTGVDPNIQKSKKKEIIAILNSYGLRVERGTLALEKMLEEQVFIKNEQIKEEQVLEYVLRSGSGMFGVENLMQARKALSRLSFGLEKYKDEFIIEFLTGKELNGKPDRTLRGYEKEDAFINELSNKGIYITSLGKDVPQITDMQSLLTALKSNAKNISISTSSLLKFYEEFEENIHKNTEFERLVLENVSNSLFANGKTKSEDIIKFENLYGVRIYSYDANIGGRITQDRLIQDIMSGKAKVMPVDVNQLKSQMKTLPAELQTILNESIRDREERLQRAKEIRELAEKEKSISVEHKDNTQRISDNQPAQNNATNISGQDTVSNNRHVAFYEETAAESDMKKMLVNIYNLYGREHSIYALELYASKGNSQLFPKTNATNDYLRQIDSQKALDTIILSYTKRVLRRMEENKLGDSYNPKEKLLENIIVETYKAGVNEHDDTATLENIKQAISQYISSQSIEGFPKDNEAAKDLKRYISKSDIFNIMFGAEIDELLTEKDDKGNPLIIESETDAKIKSMDNLMSKINLKEGMFINRTMECFNASTSVEKSSIGANLYASLSQNKYDENKRRADLVNKHREMIKSIEELRKEKIKQQANLIGNGISEPAGIMANIQKIDEALKRMINDYQILMTDEYTPGKSNMMIIAEYESKIRVLKQIDECNREDKKHGQYIQNTLQSEVADIGEI